MHCDMLKIQDGGAIVEKLNCILCSTASNIFAQRWQISQLLTKSRYYKERNVQSKKRQAIRR